MGRGVGGAKGEEKQGTRGCREEGGSPGLRCCPCQVGADSAGVGGVFVSSHKSPPWL